MEEGSSYIQGGISEHKEKDKGHENQSEECLKSWVLVLSIGLNLP